MNESLNDNKWGQGSMAKIRLLVPADAENYSKIRLEALRYNADSFATTYSEEKGNPIEKYKSRFRSDTSFTLGAFEGDSLVGIITLVREQYYKLRHRANIVAMYVTPAKRKQGVGKSLLIEVIKLAKNINGVEQLYLTVITTNRAAIELYSTLGFNVFAIEEKAMKLEGYYLDEQHMVLFLEK
ncbi:GNAT family N-acetyltransferase [Lederbergia galactosidilytica]|nr:GNAT family N-acetyltransferase [Lederbergia galactosidilytica]MBP1914497.1 RimJ/RimL family protein N-acetyltransferase [Lederbergia galactosidilytica]